LTSVKICDRIVYINKKSAGNHKVSQPLHGMSKCAKPHPPYTRNSSVPANNIIHYFMRIVKYTLVALQRNFCAVWFRHAAFLFWKQSFKS